MKLKFKKRKVRLNFRKAAEFVAPVEIQEDNLGVVRLLDLEDDSVYGIWCYKLRAFGTETRYQRGLYLKRNWSTFLDCGAVFIYGDSKRLPSREYFMVKLPDGNFVAVRGPVDMDIPKPKQIRLRPMKLTCTRKIRLLRKS